MLPALSRRFLLATLLFLALLILAPPLRAPTSPLCDVTCEPDPSSPSYAGTFQARPKSHNARGQSSLLAQPAPASATTSPTLPGSESYNYAIPILSLPGRNGLDLNLTLFYNSRVWTIDKDNGTATFNADRDWPGYGFRLGFGYLELNSLTYLLTEPDGSKRELRLKSGSTNIYETVDSSYIDYNSTTQVLRRKDGSQWKYERVGTTTLYRPIEIKDTNGNFISISYNTEANFRRYLNSTNKDRWVTTGSVGAGYTFEFTLGTLFGNSQPGTQPLYGCKVTGTSDHFISLQANCEGQTFLRTEGWIFSSPPAGVSTQALYRCRMPSDHFVSTDPNCEGKTVEGLLGYAKTTAPFNSQAINTITDTLGRVIQFNYDPDGKLISVTGPALAGGTKTYASFTWNQVALAYAFTLSVVDSPTPSGTLINVITACRYANNTGYDFIYGDWGIVKEIKQVSSTGALRSSVSYNYPTTATALSDHPTFTTQTVNDGSQDAIWTYGVVKSGGLVREFRLTSPLVGGTQATTTTFLFTTGWQTGLVEKVTVASGGTTFRTITNTWTQDSPGSAILTNPRVTSVTTTLENTPPQQSKVEFSYTTYGNVSEVREFDYGPTLARKTQADYQTGAGYTNLHILDRPVQVRVYDAAGALKARTDLEYDISTPLQGLTPNPIQWANPGATRGNLTKITRYENAATGSGAIVRTFTYDTAGNLRTADLDCCQQRSWTFSATTQYSYPDSIVSGPATGPQLTTSRIYDFNTGLVISATDENGKTTTFGYDSMNRLTSVTRPDNVTLNFSFDDTSTFPASTSITPIDATKSLVRVTTFDGLGRPVRVETKDAAGGNCSAVDTQHDALGRPFNVSNPYPCGGAPGPWTETKYDELGRVVKVIPPGGTDTGNNTQFAYSGNSVTITDPASKQRRSFTDALGRLVRVDEPGYADGVAATGSVTISGTLQSTTTQIDPCLEQIPPSSCPRTVTIYDSGSVWITVNGATKSVSYGNPGNSTASAVASALRTAINADSNYPVTAGGTGAIVTLQAKEEGAHTNNYTLSAGSATSSPDFTSPSFTAAPSGPTLTGGADGGGGDGSPPSINTPLPTLYTYDPLDNLIKVIQGVQSRTFVYDSLGRLTSATTPEGGTVTYTYTSFSQVSTRTDARGVVTTYSYEGLRRLSGVSYSVPAGVAATPAVNFTYGTDPAQNNKGRLLTMTDGPGSETYTYDSLGRITGVTKTVDSVNYVLGYSYNLANELLTINYPSGRIVTQTYDPIGRLSQISSGGTNYLSGVTYNDAYLPTHFQYGNTVAADFTYNSRLQLESLRYSKAATDLFKLTYDYGAGNNGQIQSITDNADASRSMTYTYDAWARLKTATAGPVAAPTWKLSWDYDRFGNRKNQNVLAGSAPAPQLAISSTTNRITSTGYTYDASGNLTNDTLHSYVYDGENRVTQADAGTTATYTYDGAGLRVKKVAGSSTTRYVFSGTKVIAEYTGATPTLSKEYIYAGSQLLATLSSTGVPTYHHPDHLSVRVNTDSAGTVVGQQGHYPFGESWYSISSTTKWQFTSYERDSESGLDYAMFRYDSSRLGRFMTPDPLAGSTWNPQSLNRYAYVLNDPTDLIDPLGLDTTIVCWWQCVEEICTNVNGCHCKRYAWRCRVAETNNPAGDAFFEPPKAGPKFAPLLFDAPCIITQGFNPDDPVDPHTGIDVKASLGTPVQAPEGGSITNSNDKGRPIPYVRGVRAPLGATNFVELQGDSGYTWRFVHVTPQVPKGGSVEGGDQLGVTDKTGRQTGPHLHIQVKDPSDKLIDPATLLRECKPEKKGG